MSAKNYCRIIQSKRVLILGAHNTGKKSLILCQGGNKRAWQHRYLYKTTSGDTIIHYTILTEIKHLDFRPDYVILTYSGVSMKSITHLEHQTSLLRKKYPNVKMMTCRTRIDRAQSPKIGLTALRFIFKYKIVETRMNCAKIDGNNRISMELIHHIWQYPTYFLSWPPQEVSIRLPFR